MADLLIFAGTRPEIIKLYPVLHAARTAGLSVDWVATGQHGTLAEETYQSIGVTPSRRIELEWDRASLTSLTSALIAAAGGVLAEAPPRFVLVQGDTASAFAGATAAFLAGLPLGHVEAGLRTAKLCDPFPEEGFRRLIAPLAALHFTPTVSASRNLRREGVAPEAIIETGNTVIDAVMDMAPRAVRPAELAALPDRSRLVLVTAHRRENWDERLDEICSAILSLRDRHRQAEFVLPVHANPRVADRIRTRLSGQARVHLLPSLPYPEFLWLIKQSALILTDSGGVQEEAAALQKPMVIMRETTERMEVVKSGAARLVPVKSHEIAAAASSILANPVRRWMMSGKKSPFGDGRAAARIVDALVGKMG